MKSIVKTSKKGFTLIELLVVIAIIGILSSIGLVALNGAREKARDAQRVSDLAQLRTALAIYYDSNTFKYPMDPSTLDGGAGTCIGNNSRVYLAASGAAFSDIFATFTANIFTGGSSASYPATQIIIPTYLGAKVLPPTAVAAPITGEDLYCYDANGDAAAEDRSKYFLYTKLESADAEWYWLDSDGRNDTTPTPHTAGTCSDNGPTADACIW